MPRNTAPTRIGRGAEEEDASLGRLYLPRDALQAAGIASSEPREVEIGRAHV